MSEVVPKPPGSPWVVESLNSDNLGDIVALFGGDKSRMDLLVDDRLIFTQRTLTYPGDVLDAFRGILARSTYISPWGVPIIPKGTTRDPSKGLALGLTWSKNRLGIFGVYPFIIEQNFDQEDVDHCESHSTFHQMIFENRPAL
jgi:hypothetical protein